MARRTFVGVDITEIYVHWYAAPSELAASLGVDRKTIRKYPEPAEASGITPGGPPMREADWAKLIKSWFPELTDRRLRQITRPEIDQHRDYINCPSTACRLLRGRAGGRLTDRADPDVPRRHGVARQLSGWRG
ncbi:hypothetical protein ACFY15_30715 [Streptomyces sp. NPDC001373]|uniref:hypothetical protein n=1 Tax=Streptomyces sp. NPDC001373 TaxID=3364565 RepID=UPI003673CA14